MSAHNTTTNRKPKSVIVWVGIIFDGKAPLIFIEDGVKINQIVYRTMLQNKLLPWTQELFGDRYWTFQ